MAILKILGHRGCRGKHNPPENSRASFRAARDQGADGIELDVFLTKDNHLVVFHDDTLERMTDGSGHITDHTLAELKKLRLKNPDGTLSNEIIPTLDEVLDDVEEFRRENPNDKRAQDFLVNIEIKTMKGKNIAVHVADTVKKRLANGWKLDNFLISSFDHASLRDMHKTMPKLPRGVLLASEKEPWDITVADLEKHLAATQDIHAKTVNITLPSFKADAKGMPGWMIREALAQPVAWTCNEKNPDEMSADERKALFKHITDSCINVLITDYPQEMRRLLSLGKQAGQEPAR